jgi:hypothetical protein
MWMCPTCNAATPENCHCNKPTQANPEVQATSVDAELAALRSVASALTSVSPEARARVMRWAFQYFDIRDGRY